MSPSRVKPLRVGDLFCGAGGFSEGFEQAGFRIAWAVDNWHPAAETFKKNHPTAEVLEENILELEPRVLNRMGGVDVLIGSPPCTHFSAANKGGRGGDRKEGMKLVHRFLDFVRALEPKYWVMENVPGLRKDLGKLLREGHLELDDGPLRLPMMEVLDSAEYGVPQSRRRLYSGDFPVPSPSRSYQRADVLTLRGVIDTLPDPREAPTAGRAPVHDPVYDGQTISRSRLRDHFEDTRWALTQDEVDSSIQDREYHRIYGKMPFPDGLDRPSRTITATRTRGSRSTVIVPCEGRQEVPYRTLTLRECASAQGFPLSYQFWASSMSDKDALVGNAVAPPVARSIANAILVREGRLARDAPVVRDVTELPPLVHVRRLGPKHFSMRRRFRGIVPIEWVHERRVELDNEFTTFPSSKDKSYAANEPSVAWKTRLYLGYASEYRCYDLTLETGIQLARSVLRRPRVDDFSSHLTGAILPLVQNCLNGYPRATELQERWTGRRQDVRSPHEILRSIAAHVGRGLPKSEWLEVKIPVSATDSTLRPRCIVHGSEADESQPAAMPARLFASAIALTIVCERLNQGLERLETLVHALLSREGFLSESLDFRARGKVAREVSDIAPKD